MQIDITYTIITRMHPAAFLCVSVSSWGNTIEAILPQPPYSPDLASADLFLFPRIKTPLNIIMTAFRVSKYRVWTSWVR